MRKNTTLILLAMMITGMFFAVVPAIAEQEDDPDKIIPFIYGASSSPSGFDPLAVYDTTSGDIINNVFEGLYAIDYATDEVVARLAEDKGSWSDDNTMWNITLRDDVTWHDGSDFTADDVKWNFDRLKATAISGDCDHASLWFNDDGNFILNETNVLGDHEIQFILDKAWYDFEALMPFWGAAMVKPVDGYEESVFDLTNIDILDGTGPFMLESYTPDEQTVCVQNPDYYRGAPDIRELVFQVFASADAMDSAFLNHEIQVARGISNDAQPDAEADPDLTVEKVKSSCCFFYHLNVKNIPWAARKAMQFAFNYTYFIEVVRNGREYEHHTPVPEGMEGYNPDLPGLPYYNLTKAREYILESDEYADEVAAAELTAESTDADWETVAAESPLDTFNFTDYGLTTWYDQMADNFADIGFDIVHDIVGDWPTFLTYTDENKDILEITMGGWCPDYYDPVNMIEPLFGGGGSSNWNGLNDSAINAKLALMHQVRGEEKLNLTDEVVTDIFVEEAAGMYIMQSAQFVLYNNVQITAGADDLKNVRGDKYFYNINFVESAVPQGIPGYSLGIFVLASLGAAAALIIRKRK